jgi:AraC-like DNA-binding protein
MTLLFFPSFNAYSLPLLLLTAVGYAFAVLLARRWHRQRHLPDLFLALLLLATGFRCTAYTIGFMGWYDTYQQTKVNYFLFSMAPVLGPLVYFYLRALVYPNFRLSARHGGHFAFQGLYMLYMLVLWLHDRQQPGFGEVQNGAWFEGVHLAYVGDFIELASAISQTLYYAFSVQLFWQHRERIAQHFSNPQPLALLWVQSVLGAYIGLFLFLIVMSKLDELGADWHWTQKWWWHLANSSCMAYMALRGYFMKWEGLAPLEALPEPDDAPLPLPSPSASQRLAGRLSDYLAQERPYLYPDLSLADLAAQLQVSPQALSHAINAEIGQHFNDLVNGCRVAAVQQAIQEGALQRLSLLGLALECGFNSKATFNRAFKKATGQSPSDWMRQAGVSNAYEEGSKR